MSTPSVELELVVSQARNTVPVRVILRKLLTTLGSSPEADVSLPLMPAQWAVVQRRDNAALVRLIATGGERLLQPGQHFDIGEASLALADRSVTAGPLRAGEIASALTSADCPDAALRGIVEGVIRSLDADTGAAVISEGSGYRVAIAVDAAGQPLPNAAELLSDTVVRDVLGSGNPLCVGDVGGDERYASVPSVIALALQSVVCVPMCVGDRVLGALFIGRRDLSRPFTEAQTRELVVLGSMTLPVLAQLRRGATASAADALLVGEHATMIELRRMIARTAPSNLAVLISGETGTGKEVTARVLHAASPRAARRMVAINCSAIAPNLLESELFGYARGAFTGAVADRAGRIEEASGSTLFLDEVGDMPLAMQAALLRVLQEGEVVRVGEGEPRPVDLRLVAATNKELDAEVEAGNFREDLLFRLREITIELPPLRARGDDLGLLSRLFLHQAERELSLPVHSLAASAEGRLADHSWPGNVRELRAAMRRAAVLCDGTEITGADLQLGASAAVAPAAAPRALPAGLGDLGRSLADARDEFVRRYAEAVIEAHGGDRNGAATALGISVRSLYRYLS